MCAQIFLSRSVELMAQTAGVSFVFKVKTFDWLDQVGCYGDRSETACFK